MSKIPENLKYSKTHEWIKIEDEETVVIGITDYAQDALGDLVYIELPEVEQHIEIDANCGVLESVKTASDLYAPISGTVLEHNEEVSLSPEAINHSPYEEGWIMKVKLSNKEELNNLLTAEQYSAFLAEQG